VGGLIAVAVLPVIAGISGASYLDPAEFSRGFQTAVLASGSLCVVGGAVAALGIRNPSPVRLADPSFESGYFHCALEAAPLATKT
jgi:hypothetical protein